MHTPENKADLPLISLNDVCFVRKERTLLEGITLAVFRGRTLSVIGPNGSGKSLLAGVLCGSLRPTGGSRSLSSDLDGNSGIGCISFELQKAIMEEERRNDDSEFMHGRLDPGRSVRKFLLEASGTEAAGSETEHGEPERELFLELTALFGLRSILDRGLRFLSSGEFRKTLICRALLARPEVLVLDDPFDGLDVGTREILQKSIETLHRRLAVVVISGRLDDVPAFSDEVRVLNEGRLLGNGEPEAAEKLYRELISEETAGIFSFSAENTGELSVNGRELIRMSGINVSYYDVPVLRGIEWTVREGEHWRIVGPNGSGKSTLLDLISGDNPKAYGQELYLFGRKKGSGETVWDIKRRLGFVSGGFHLAYRVKQNVLGVVLSGFFDSVGLYDEPNPVQREIAAEWCARFGLSRYLDSAFGELSFGLQRVVLIARAVVKKPELLILDEPCQGVDDVHSRMILYATEYVARENHSTVLFVTHDPVRTLPSIGRTLLLVPAEGGGSTAVTR